MKNRKSSLIVLILICLCLILLPQTSVAEQEFEVGGKFLGKTPCVISSLIFEQFGVEVGGGMGSTHGSTAANSSYEISSTYYFINGRYLFPLSDQISPYIGMGLIGINGTATIEGHSVSGHWSVTGSFVDNSYDMFGGLEVSLANLGLPITAFGGVNYLGFGDMEFDYEGGSFETSIQIGGITFHLGVKFKF